MTTTFLNFILAVFFNIPLMAQLSPGDEAPGFKLKNIDGKMISLDDFTSEKGVILIFTCNHCPYAVAYEDRIIDLNDKYAPKGYPVVAINPNDPALVPEDSFENMQERANEKDFDFPYLFDEGQRVFPQYGATRTPHIFLIQNEGKKFIVRYIGAIDDNYKDASAVEEKFLENAIAAIEKGEMPDPATTKAIGCTIKVKK